MEIKFNETPCRCVRSLADQTVQREETQEVRLPDGMPDIGRILGCWGQVVLRGKEWRAGSINISGGIMAWALYAPEDGSEPRSMETWIPFQQKWDFEDTGRDGFICVVPRLRSMDARSTSPRKLMVRANLSTWGRALESGEEAICQPEDVPEDVQLLRQSYPMELPRECGEKPVSIDDEQTLPDTAPPVEKILRYELTPRILEQKILASRLVFRGIGKLKMLYCSGGKVHSFDAEIPFSQYADLDREYGSGATAQILPVVTNLEVDAAEGRVQVKAALAAQYILHDRVMVDIVEDAYSPVRNVEIRSRELKLPMRLDQWSQAVQVSQSLRGEIGNVVDICCMADHPQRRQKGDEAELTLSGCFQVLYTDPAGNLQGGTARFEQAVPVASDSGNAVEATVMPEGAPQLSASGEGVEIGQELLLETAVLGHQGQQMVTGLELGEQREPDPGRPSIILRRCGDRRLWDMAKESGSTVEAIRKANGLEGEPESGRMLLIPVS